MRTHMPTHATSDLSRLHGRLDRVFGDFWNGLGLSPPGSAAPPVAYVPPVAVHETMDALVVRMEVPGVDPSTIEVAASGDELHVTGRKLREELPEKAKWVHDEFAVGEFRRVLPLPSAFDADGVTATAKFGVLTIRLPKRAEILPKQIEIQVE